MAVLNLFKDTPTGCVFVRTVQFDPSVDSEEAIERKDGADLSLYYDTIGEATEALKVHPLVSYDGAGELPMP